MDRIGEVREILADMQRLCPAGFAVALHVRFTTPRFLFQTYARDWMQHYSEKGMVLDDPTVKWGLQNEGRIDWSELEDQDVKGVLAQAREHGLRFGFTAAIAIDESRSVGSFARGDRAFTEAETGELLELFRKLHARTAVGTEQEASISDILKSLSVELTHR